MTNVQFALAVKSMQRKRREWEIKWKEGKNGCLGRNKRGWKLKRSRREPTVPPAIPSSTAMFPETPNVLTGNPLLTNFIPLNFSSHITHCISDLQCCANKTHHVSWGTSKNFLHQKKAAVYFNTVVMKISSVFCECRGHKNAPLAFVLPGCVFKIQGLWSLSGRMLSPDGGGGKRKAYWDSKADTQASNGGCW